jgi:nucleoid DNA-binding protein
MSAPRWLVQAVAHRCKVRTPLAVKVVEAFVEEVKSATLKRERLVLHRVLTLKVRRTPKHSARVKAHVSTAWSGEVQP